MKLGLITDCTKLPLEQAIVKAAELGVSAVQIYATSGVFCPDIPLERKKFFKKLIKDNGLKVSALCGDMGGVGFEKKEDNALRIEKTKRIIDLAVFFETDVVTTHIGCIPENPENERYGVMLDALTECGIYAKSQGVTMAIETGPETARVLKGFLDKTKGGVGVNLDPANFTMVTEQDAAEAVEILREYIVHTHAKDGRKIDKSITPEDVYHNAHYDKELASRAYKSYVELPIGQGDVNWPEYLSALKKIGYDGYVTIEREAGPDPFEDIKEAIGFLNKQFKNL